MKKIVRYSKILFYISTKRINKGGLSPIYCRITSIGKRAEISTGIFIEAQYFKNGNILTKNNYLTNLQKQLDLIKCDLAEVETNLKIKKQSIDAQNIKNIYFNGFKESYTNFIYVASEWLDKQKILVGIDFSFNSYLQRQRTIQSFIKFLNEIKKPEVFINEIKEGILNDYCLYCYKNFKLSKCTLRRRIQIIKSIVSYAVINDYAAKNYVSNFSIKLSRGSAEIKALSLEQVKTLQEAKFNSLALNYTRDCFLFQCYTGLAYADLSAFSMQNINTDNNGKLWCIVHRQKTTTKSTIPLITEALELIKKYNDLGHKADNNIKNTGLMPVYCNQVYNRLLKQIGLICNIDNSIMTSHTARKTFATITLNSGGVSIETVSKMLGHSKISMTQQYYAHVDTKKIANEMQNFSFTNQINN